MTDASPKLHPALIAIAESIARRLAREDFEREEAEWRANVSDKTPTPKAEDPVQTMQRVLGQVAEMKAEFAAVETNYSRLKHATETQNIAIRQACEHALTSLEQSDTDAVAETLRALIALVDDDSDVAAVHH